MQRAWTGPCGGDYFQLKFGELLARDYNLPEDVGEGLELLLWEPGGIFWHRAGEKDTLSTSVQYPSRILGSQRRQQPSMLGDPIRSISSSGLHEPHMVTAV